MNFLNSVDLKEKRDTNQSYDDQNWKSDIL